MNDVAICWQTLLKHLPRSGGALCRGILGDRVMSTGSGPCDEDTFDNFLNICKVELYPVSEDISDGAPNVLVIGHHGWDEEELDSALQARVGSTLRVYSQEMVVASLALGEDVFEFLDEDELASFGREHPALQYLEQRGFAWPTTDIQISGSHRTTVDFTAMDSPETGLLKHMGYQVGLSGLDEKQRRRILDSVMSMDLRPASARDRYYLAQWGRPSSAKRLSKMANCLASFASSKKRVKSKDYSAAIADWESDLAYLRKAYSGLRTQFSWPSTKVH